TRSRIATCGSTFSVPRRLRAPSGWPATRPTGGPPRPRSRTRPSRPPPGASSVRGRPRAVEALLVVAALQGAASWIVVGHGRVVDGAHDGVAGDGCGRLRDDAVGTGALRLRLGACDADLQGALVHCAHQISAAAHEVDPVAGEPTDRRHHIGAVLRDCDRDARAHGTRAPI